MLLPDQQTTAAKVFISLIIIKKAIVHIDVV